MILFILVLFVVMHIVCDLNYFLRTLFTVLSSRIYHGKCSLDETTTIYGLCTFQDCDPWGNLRLTRVVRELDFARYHFYDQTGVYDRSSKRSIRSLQGSTLVTKYDTIRLFHPYKIDTKLVYWDNRSLFFEHELITLHDGEVKAKLVSRQYALGAFENCVSILLEGVPGYKEQLACPEYLEYWLKSQQISSLKLRSKS